MHHKRYQNDIIVFTYHPENFYTSPKQISGYAPDVDQQKSPSTAVPTLYTAANKCKVNQQNFKNRFIKHDHVAHSIQHELLPGSLSVDFKAGPCTLTPADSSKSRAIPLAARPMPKGLTVTTTKAGHNP